MTTTLIAYTIFVYLLASIPFAVVLGKVFHNIDIREFGDGNPGATNLKRATDSVFWFVVALLLDGFKALFPIGIPYHFLGWTGLEIVPIAIAALCGHAFSIYLGFSGGKAIATTGGVWVGLIILEGVAVIATGLVLWYYLIEEDDWAVIFMMLTLLGYLLITRSHEAPQFAIWAANFAIIAYKHRGGLDKLPTLKSRGGNSQDAI